MKAEKIRIGPEITVRKSCSGCKYCVTEHYHVQGDSGFDKYCCHPTLEERQYIGFSWNTPDFCPEDKPTHQEGGECYVKCHYADSTHRAIEHGTGIGDDPIRKVTLPQISEGEIDKKIHSLVVKLQILFEAERGELGMLDMSKKGLAEAGRISDHYDDKKAAHIKQAINQIMKGGEGRKKPWVKPEVRTLSAEEVKRMNINLPKP